MSIILKGIDMPKCLNEDILVVIRRDKAEVLQTGYKERIVEAIQIDRPHGRLIDRSVLFEEYQNLCNGLLCRDCPFFKENSCSIEEWILNQPTILESEE